MTRDVSSPPARSVVRPLLVAVVVFISCAYFYEGGGWNQNTRFDLVRAIVEGHTVRIDAYHENTGDKARVGTHYYSDKAPGASLTAVPFTAVAYYAMRAFGVNVDTPKAITALSYAATLGGAALPAAIAALGVFLIARRLGADDGAAGFGAVVCGLATPFWPYATILYGHTLAGACLILAFLGALGFAGSSAARPVPSADIVRGVLIGFAAGWAVVTEYPAAVPGGLICLFAAWQVRAAGRDSLIRVIAAVGVGLAIAAIVLLAYNTIAFGAPLYVTYSSEVGSFEEMKTGLFGIGLPRLDVLWDLLFGAYRGLIPLAPILVVTPMGFWLLCRAPATRPAALVAGAVAAFYFLMTAGYAYWSGGWSYGSRHVGPALPFLALAVAPLWQRTRTEWRAILGGLAAAGIALSLVAVATTPQPPSDVKHPMRDLLWPAFRSGDFPIGWQSAMEMGAPTVPLSQLEREGVPRASWNLGQLAGLTSHASLLPLLTVWIVGAGLWRVSRQALGTGH